MVDSGQLLHAYQQRHDEGAFSELVNRHIDLVYSTALRRTGGDAHLAQDIAQTVFTDLARKARRLPGNVVLGGWLYRHTCFTAAKALRSERRRQIREGEAVAMNAQNEPTDAIWRQIAPVLDEAMNGLNEDDRNAIVRRFFEQQPFREVGAALRTGEDAARMRVDRALEKLRKFLIRRGVTCSGAALSTVLAEELLTAAPAGLATNIAGAALAGTAAGTGTTVTFLKLMAMTKPKAGMVTAVVPAGLATSLVVQHRSLGRPRQENAELSEQSKQLDQLRAENERLGKPRVDANELQGLRREHGELMRLRGEVASLRNENQRLASRQADNQRLPHQLSAAHSALDSEETPNEFLPADKWSDMGSATPETAARTWIWWRRNGNLERDQPLPGEDGRGREDAKSAPWNKEFKEVTDQSLA